MKRTAFILILLCLLSGVVYAQNPTFETKASNTTVSVGEPFRILFTIGNANQVSGFKAPDFKGFEILQNSQSQSISIINGQTSRKLSYVFTIRPTAVGNFTIHGASVRINGNETHSNPISITVTKNSNNSSRNQSQTPPQGFVPSRPTPSSPQLQQLQNRPAVLKPGEDPMEKIKKNVFVKVEIDKKDIYIGQQITADYKLYTRLPTSSQVTKVPTFLGFSTHDLPIPQPLRPTMTEVDGKQYRVFTFRKSMLFPLQTGTQTLDPVQIENDVKLYKVEKSSGGGNSLGNMANDPFFKDMFDDPFFKQAFGRGMQLEPHEYKYDMSSPVVKIHVKPLPEEGKPKNVDNAVGQFTIKATVDKTNLTTDDAASFTVTINGKGNVNLLSAPTIQFPGKLESYDPKIKDNFHNTNPFGGSRSFTYVLMPNATGNITIPAVSFSYFNPDSATYKTVHTQPITLHVSQGKNQIQTEADSGTIISQNKLLPIKERGLTWKKTGSFWFGSYWHWILMLLPILILIILLLWKRKQDALTANQVLLKNKKANRVALKRLSLARKYLKQNKSKLFYEEISHSIWGYLCDKLNIPLSELTKQKAEDRLHEKDISDKLLQKLFTLLDRCEMALYAGVSGHEEMESTYIEAAKIISELESKLKKKTQ